MMLAQRFPVAPPLGELRREMERLFDGFMGNAPGPLYSRSFPSMNLWEDDQRLVVEAEVPGMGLDDLDITIQGNELTLKGQRKPINGEDATYHRRERGTGTFARYLTLPVEVDADRVEAALKDGVLTILLPKSEKARARKITVRNA